MEKMEVHKKGILHRAFSVMIFNDKGEVLLQKRADKKYHSPGLWSISCCSHQREGETLTEAVSRRINEELGITCDCKEEFKFKYQIEFDNGLIEHELDHIFIGHYNGKVFPNKDEVGEICWASLDKLNKEMSEHPENFTYWFKILTEQPKMQLIWQNEILGCWWRGLLNSIFINKAKIENLKQVWMKACIIPLDLQSSNLGVTQVEK